jgi:ubiquinone/menaquinone biosynthesis C-methylase UbiE
MVATSASFTAPEHYHEDLAPFTFVPFARALGERIPPRLHGPVLEIACGTGVLTRVLRDRMPAPVELVATDLSAAMLAYARSRLEDATGIRCQEADAMQLPLEQGSFGSVACGFGFMFAPDPQQALAEVRRVLEANGRLLFSVWDRIEENPHALANAEVIEALFPDEPQMKFRLPYGLHDEGRLTAMLQLAGFGDV